MSNAVGVDEAWTPSSAEGRWSGLGPYYAMFPTSFVRKSIEKFCPPKGRVLDPFCGRGTSAFVAAVSGRHALGTDTNPVAWVYSSVKTDPCKSSALLMKRVREILDSVDREDRQAANEFQRFAWHPDVLGFLQAARRELKWKRGRVDRTLMAIILVHLHAKLGEGLSNQMRQSKAMSPDYAVEWWKQRKLNPPKINVEEFFEKKLLWRYAKGIPNVQGRARVELGDARRVLPTISKFSADLLLTSPPYFGVTNYDYDNWIRLWMLGGPALPNHLAAARYAHPERYEDLIGEVFEEARCHMKDNCTVYVRTDARPFTLETTLDVLADTWPDHEISVQFDKAKGKTQTGLFQVKWEKAGEVDLLLIPRRTQFRRAAR